MPLYRLASSRLEPVLETTFEREELTERGDLRLGDLVQRAYLLCQSDIRL